MNAGKIVALLAIMLAFAAGKYLGGAGTNGPVVVTSSSGGSAYQGAGEASEGQGELTVSGSDKAVAGPPSTDVVVVVEPGQSIQEAVQAAAPGTTIQVMPGTYSETVYIDKDGIHLLGIIKAGERAILDGKGEMNDAILFSGNNIVVQGFRITRYKGNAIMSQAGNNYEIRDNIIVDTGVYGIFPQLGTNGVVEHQIGFMNEEGWLRSRNALKRQLRINALAHQILQGAKGNMSQSFREEVERIEAEVGAE